MALKIGERGGGVKLVAYKGNSGISWSAGWNSSPALEILVTVSMLYFVARMGRFLIRYVVLP